MISPQSPDTCASSENDIVEDVGVLCNSEDITLTLRVSTDTFNGMIYPKGLSKNSTCMTEYIQQEVDTIHIQCQQEKSISFYRRA